MHLPTSIIRYFVAPLWAYKEHSKYIKVKNDLLQRERISPDQRLAEQFTAVKAIVTTAWNNSRFYRNRFKENGFQPEDLKSWSDFEKIPILTKDDIRNNSETILDQSTDKRYLVPRKTSGSTGVNLNFFVDDREYQYKRGVTLYRDGWTGWRLGDWRAMVWGNPSYLSTWRGRMRNHLLERMFSLDTLRMDEAMMEAFFREILSLKPTLLFGHAHSLYLFANFWESTGKPKPSFKGIISTAMVLHGYERQKCESVFGAQVFDRYGCEEVSLIASECEHHQGLHVNTDALYVECKKGGENPEGGIIVTDYKNTVFPFIRYAVGDMAIPSSRSCDCGRTYPLLDRVAGRVADYLRTADGHWISGISLTENFATLIKGIKQVQIIQDKKEHILLKIVEGEAYNQETQEEIVNLMEQRFGKDMTFSIKTVRKIEPESSGKYRFAICLLDEKGNNKCLL